ncbi:MAG: hypothetical protein HYX53_05115 [Chloroflexi bacterium]|nr:hypothetical protein [Chloroflexota bacterium]
MKAAIGVRDHSGWAALIVVAGPIDGPRVLIRRRISLNEPPLPRQPYHAAEGLDIARAAAIVARVEASAGALAAAALREAVHEAAALGADVCGLAVGGAIGAVPGDLGRILASHALLHGAEGELYRRVLVAAAAEDLGLTVTRFLQRDLYDVLGARLGASADGAKTRVANFGKLLGPPWTSDEKEATAGAWLALARPDT